MSVPNTSSKSFDQILERYVYQMAPAEKPPKHATRSAVAKNIPRKKTSTVPEQTLTSSVDGPSPTKKRKRTTSGYAPPSKYAHLVNNLTDSLAPNLICVLVGLNPGIRTATTGHA
ncbi:MAG: hypothetical protein Q9183_005878, partial [Haloplaca sp. 2 TL-2023]